jgi:hypothetical protein
MNDGPAMALTLGDGERISPLGYALPAGNEGNAVLHSPLQWVY